MDPRGCLRIELPGLWPALTRGTPDPRDDVRAVAHMVHRLLTGVDPSSTGAPALRGVRGLDAAWDTWMLKGLSPLDGFRTAAEALSALPVRTDADEVRPADAAKPGVVQSWIRKLREVL